MASLKLYELRPRPGVGFHFGEQGLEQEESSLIFSSDSFFSACVATVAEQEGEKAATDFVAPFLAANTPPFRLTSLFPYVGTLPLLPLPRLHIHIRGELDRKFAKKVQFVSPGIFKRLLFAEPMDDYLDDEQGQGRYVQGRAVWLTVDELPQLPHDWAKFQPLALRAQTIWSISTIPHVTLDRLSTRSVPFLVGQIRFSQGCGLWLGVSLTDAAWQKRLEGILHHLGDRGIGGERTTGLGAFELIPNTKLTSPLPSPLPQSAYQVLLSRYHPQRQEIAVLQDDQVAYQLVTIGGWLISPATKALRRRRVTLVAEGSVIGTPAHGDLADVTPDPPGILPHKVYRYGFSLGVPALMRDPKQ